MKLSILNRSIKKNKAAALTIGICCAIGTFLITGLTVLRFAIDASFEHVYETLSGPCAVISSEDEETFNNMISLLSVQSEKTMFGHLRRCVVKGANIADREYPFVYVAYDSNIPVSDTGIIANNTVNGLNSGDIVTFDSESITYSVERISEDPVNAAPDIMNTVLYVNYETFKDLAAHSTRQEYVINVFGSVPYYPGDLETLYQTNFDNHFTGSVKTFDDIKNDYLFRFRLIADYLTPVAIVILCFIMVLIIMLTNMILISDQGCIDVYHVIGMSRKRIVALYLIQFTQITVMGGLLGSLTSMLILKIWLGNMFRAFPSVSFVIRGSYLWITISVFAILIAESAVVFITTYLHSNEYNAVTRRNTRHSRLHIRVPFDKVNKCISIPVLLGLSYGIKRKWQTIAIAATTVFIGGIILFTVLLCGGVVVRNDHLPEWGIADLDIYVSRIGNTDERESGLLEYIEASDHVDYYYAALSDTVYYKAENATGNVTADIYDGSILDEMSQSVIAGSLPQSLDEAVIGMNFARNNNISIGDYIVVTHGSDTRRLCVTGIYASYKQHSDSIAYAVENIINYFENNADGYYSIVLKDDADASGLAAEMQQAFPDFRFILMKRGIMNTVINMLLPLLLILLLCTIVFILILRVLLRMLIIDSREDLKTYTYFGTSLKNICMIVRSQMLPTAICAAILTIPLAITLIPKLFANVAHELGLWRIPVYPSALTILPGICIIAIASMIALKKRSIISEIAG